MKFYVQELPHAHDPNSGATMDMWIVWADGEGGGDDIRQFAYCSKPEYAEHIAKLEAENDACQKRIGQPPTN